MFLARTPPLAYTNPWNVSFEDRLAQLCSGRHRIAYFYDVPDTNTFRYRVFNMVEALNAATELGTSASWFSLADATRLNRAVDQADALVLCRARYGPVVDSILTRAHARKIPVLFDVDDLVFDDRYVALILDTLDEDSGSERRWDYWFACAGRLAATLRSCQGAITTNQYLADRISDFAPGTTPRVIPNFLNRMQQEVSLALWSAKLKSGFKRDDKLHLGYFSGTRTHNRDFQVAAPALAKFMDQVPHAVLRIAGLVDLDESLGRYRDRVEVFPLQDFLNLQRLISEVEINLVPLQNNVFTNCKSDLKYFEAAVVGTLTIASPTFAFRNAIEDGQNGFLCGAHEWDSKLCGVLELVGNPDYYAELAELANKHAAKAYVWDGFASRIKSTLMV